VTNAAVLCVGFIVLEIMYLYLLHVLIKVSISTLFAKNVGMKIIKECLSETITHSFSPNRRADRGETQ
jgi:hypothetical protein